MSDGSALRNSEQALYDRAEPQSGYFTTAQAREAGYSQRQLTYYVHAGRFQRIHPGIYRLTQYPYGPHEDLYIAQLRCGPSSAISHDTALAYYGLSDVLPGRIHVTILRTASRRHARLQIHTNHLDVDDVRNVGGLRITSVARTIADVATAGLADELVVQAAREAIERGMVVESSLLDYAQRRGGRMLRLVAEAIRGQSL
jgi:predicted transcriptional regulator of viral defense system